MYSSVALLSHVVEVMGRILGRIKEEEMKFDRERLKKAKDYIFMKGRRLEQCLYSFHLENGTQQQVLDALAEFQNEDGGFGHGIECVDWSPRLKDVKDRFERRH